MPEHGSSQSRPPNARAGLWIICVAVALGLAARIVAVMMAPQESYLPDHVSNMGWSTYAFEHGPWNIYDLPERQPLVTRVRDPRSGRTGETIQLNAHACNYPPLSAYLFWVQGAVWHALDHEPMTMNPSRQLAQRFGVTGPVTTRVVDTRASRFADAFPGIVFDFFLAWGVAALVSALRPDRRRKTLEALAFAITLLAPPVFLDSAWWNQADSWITCLLVWCLVFLMRERFVLAGVVLGAALVTKPQAILFGPVLVYIVVALRFMPGGSWRRLFGLWRTAVMAILVVAVVAAPFMVSDANDEANPDGAWRWFKRSYIGTIGKTSYERTTLSAFNVWWFDLVGQGKPENGKQAQEFWSSNTEMFGVSKAMIGKLLLIAGVMLTWVLCARRWRFAFASWPACAFLIMLAAFALPTSVHERYVYYCIPFCIALAFYERRWIVPLLALLIVGTLEMTSFRWAGYPRALFFTGDGGALKLSVFLAVLTTFSLLYSFVALIPRSRERKAA